eukprot:jgi/Tetstr1/454051/TSEL_040970.t1
MPAKVARRVVCANCGARGHVFRHCTHPIISCGVICRRTDVAGSPQVLMVQRKDSFAFVEFMRGKYSLRNRRYLLELFEGMTHDERAALGSQGFDQLWKRLWKGFSKGKTRPEYEDASLKFASLQQGVRVNGEARDTDLASLLEATRGRESPEWGFPKGRRLVSNESDADCAAREMHEETGIRPDQIRITSGDVFEETFRGNNGVNYKHVYFLAELEDAESEVRTCDREIKEARWTPIEEVCRLISDAPTRVDLFREVKSYWSASESTARR